MTNHSRRLLGGTALYALTLAMAPATHAGAADDQNTTDANDIVVTATTREQQMKDAPASISVITRDEIERLPYREVTDALLETPERRVSTRSLVTTVLTAAFRRDCTEQQKAR